MDAQTKQRIHNLVNRHQTGKVSDAEYVRQIDALDARFGEKVNEIVSFTINECDCAACQER